MKSTMKWAVVMVLAAVSAAWAPLVQADWPERVCVKHKPSNAGKDFFWIEAELVGRTGGHQISSIVESDEVDIYHQQCIDVYLLMEEMRDMRYVPKRVDQEIPTYYARNLTAQLRHVSMSCEYTYGHPDYKMSLNKPLNSGYSYRVPPCWK